MFRFSSTLFPLAIALSASSAHAAPDPAIKTIVLVHGAFADGSSWDRVTPLLQARGYTVVAVQEPLSSLEDDVAATNRAIDAQSGPVLLVGHSWAGAVITQAGTNAKVKGLVYVAAFAPDAGESVNDLGKGQPAPAWAQKLVVDGGGYAWLPADVMVKEFAGDLPAAEVRLLASKQVPIATKTFDDKIKVAAWHTKPSWWVLSEEDRMIAPAAQATMAKRAGSKVTKIRSSHVVMLSHPNEVAAVILAAAGAAK